MPTLHELQISARLFQRPCSRVDYPPIPDNRVRTGKQVLSRAEVASVACCLDQGVVEVRIEDYPLAMLGGIGSIPAYKLTATNPSVAHPTVRWLIKTGEEAFTIVNESFEVAPGLGGKGVGSIALAIQVRAALGIGCINFIVGHAAGRAGSPLNGYYTWPRLGFDGFLPLDFWSSLLPSDIVNSGLDPRQRQRGWANSWRLPAGVRYGELMGAA